ncbi:MAG: hypothetical protein JF630_17740 [Geodermatophilales bacterium]|nr:hypothetical protein [Geodermatophilales bacterium]
MPVLAVLRYPEKFAALAVLALVFAGVLGWQRLLDERQAGRPQAADLPLALALVVLGTAATLVAVLQGAPGAARGFILAQGLPGLDAAGQTAGLESLRAESWAAVATAGAVALLLALCRWRRPSRPLLSLLAVLLLGADLWHYGHGLLRTVPAAVYRTPPPLAASLLPPRDRIFVQEAAAASRLVVLPRAGDPRTRVSRTYVPSPPPAPRPGPWPARSRACGRASRRRRWPTAGRRACWPSRTRAAGSRSTSGRSRGRSSSPP